MTWEDNKKTGRGAEMSGAITGNAQTGYGGSPVGFRRTGAGGAARSAGENRKTQAMQA
jgi:hypothetical protein